METHATKFPTLNCHADDDRGGSDLLRAELLSFLNASTFKKLHLQLIMEYLRAKKFHKFTKDYQKSNSVTGLEQPHRTHFHTKRND